MARWRTRRAAAPLVCILAACGTTAETAGGPVAMFRGDAAHSGVYQATLGPAIAGLHWRFDTEGAVVGSPAVLGDTVWIGSSDGRLYAIDLGTGSRLWARDLGSPIASSPAVGAGTVVAGTRDGRFHALATTDGASRWTIETGADLPLPWGRESGDRYTASPAITGGTVLIAAGDGIVRAVDLAGGRIRWRTGLQTRIRSSPAAADGRVLVGGIDGRVYALDLATGVERWRYDTEGTSLESADWGFDRRTIQSSPAVSGATVYIGARDGFLYALSADSGTLRWRVDHKISWVISSPAVLDSMVYAGTSDGWFVQAVDARTGRERWRTPTGVAVWSSPAIVGDQLVVGDGRGQVRSFDRWTGAPGWTFPTPGAVFSSPVPAGRRVIFGSLDGGVYAICTEDGVPATRAVYAGLGGVPADSAAGALTALLVSRGYEAVNDARLVALLTAAVADRRPTVVVFAADDLPAEVVTEPLDQSLFRRFLDAGGKVVWTTGVPLLWPRDSTGQRVRSLKELTWDRPSQLLGVSFSAAIFDRRMARASEAGIRWGLSGRWRDAWSIDPHDATEVLGLDDWGLAAAWVRNYGGAPGTGFVRVPAEGQAVFLAAEYRPCR